VGERSLACIACGESGLTLFLDLGETPLANAYLKKEDKDKEEPRFPLRVAWCANCFLVQLVDLVPPEQMFSEYLYFSSFSDAFVAHARGLAEWLIKEESLGGEDLVVELASNDGYLLQHFKAAGVPVLGVDPAKNIAAAANEKGIPTRCAFFHEEEAKKMRAEGIEASAILGNNVLAHVPDPVNFLKGVALLLKPGGVACFEFPHLLELLKKVEFDTVYHEHVSYISLHAVKNLLERAGLKLVDVSRQPVHGGSLRVVARHEGDPSQAVVALLQEEKDFGLCDATVYEAFGEKVRTLVADLKAFVSKAAAEGKRLAAYGAAAKGNTLLNVAGLTENDLLYVADRSTHKVGHLLPGSHLLIVPAETLAEDKPDYVLLLAWNFEQEIRKQQKAYLSGGGKFVVAVPSLVVDP
jgi:SAM-dependent methyltransferase